MSVNDFFFVSFFQPGEAENVIKATYNNDFTNNFRRVTHGEDEQRLPKVTEKKLFDSEKI